MKELYPIVSRLRQRKSRNKEAFFSDDNSSTDTNEEIDVYLEEDNLLNFIDRTRQNNNEMTHEPYNNSAGNTNNSDQNEQDTGLSPRSNSPPINPILKGLFFFFLFFSGFFD